MSVKKPINRKHQLRIIIGIILTLIGIAMLFTAIIWQQILIYHKFGMIFEGIFIPHYSAWLYTGVIPLAIGAPMLNTW